MRLRSSVLWTALIAALAVLLLAASGRPAARGAGSAGPATRVASAQVRFSPRGGCDEMIVREIGTAQGYVHVLAYNFTATSIADALAAAHRRGVDVRVVVDKSCPAEKNTVVPALLAAKVPLRVDRRHHIAHNKVMIVDGVDVETGSYNYTDSAENDNAENAIILRGWPELAGQYEADFETHWNHAEAAK